MELKQLCKGWDVPEVAGRNARVTAPETAWEPTVLPGVEVRRLHLDAAAERVTMLLRMAPGASYPPRLHAGPEECYVLLGDLTSAAARLTASDHNRSEAGSVGDARWTEAGCLLLLVASTRDEILPEPSV